MENKKKEMEWWQQKWVVAKILMKYCYLKFLQAVNKTVVHLHRNTYEIHYALHDRVYKVRTQVRRGPSRIVRVLDHQDRDITENVRAYLGPNEDFHGQPTRPQDMGYEGVVVCLRGGGRLEFDLEEPIVVR